MSFLEHECNISLAAALAFLDESMDVSDASNGSSTASASSVTSLPPTVADPELLLEALDDNLGDFTASPQIPAIPEVLQLESTPGPTQETTIVPASSAKQLKSAKKKKLNYDPNKARNERRFELACLRKEVKDLEMTLEQLQSKQGNDKRSTSRQKRG
ncbi:hypothetical protein PI125_g3111 [Phytophthora idaei]|nr:hypothetical protein PI125_g3111 [Phytophthora idaei]